MTVNCPWGPCNLMYRRLGWIFMELDQACGNDKRLSINNRCFDDNSSGQSSKFARKSKLEVSYRRYTPDLLIEKGKTEREGDDQIQSTLTSHHLLLLSCLLACVIIER